MKKSIIPAEFWLFALFFALYVLSMGGHGYGGVGTTTYDVTRQILLNRTFSIQEVPWGKFGADGKFYAQYGIGHSLYNIPFYLIGHLATKLIPALSAQYDRITMFTTLLGQPCISALTCVILFRFCLKMGYSRRAALISVLLYGLGTQAWMYAQLDFSEPLLTWGLLATAYFLCDRTPSRLVLAGIALGLTFTVKVTAAIALPVFVVYLLQTDHNWKERLNSLALFLFPFIVIGGGVVGWYNVVRFGNPLNTGYGNEFTSHFPSIAYNFKQNLWGLEGSIFLYSPVILLAIPAFIPFYRRNRAFAVWIALGVIVTFFLFYPFTTNELYYGPRYLTPTLPFWILIAGALFDQSFSFWRQRFLHVAALSLLLFGVAQQIVGVVVNYHSYYWRIQYTLPIADDAVKHSEIGQALRATPLLPHLLGHLWLIKHGVLDLFRLGGMPLSGVDLLGNAGEANAWLPYYGLDLWWCHGKILERTGATFPIIVCAILLAVIAMSGKKLSDTFNVSDNYDNAK